MAYSYVGRKQRKRQMRALWIVRLNAAARLNGLTYSRADQRAQEGRRRPRSQGPGRHRRPRCGDVCQHRRGRQGQVAAPLAVDLASFSAQLDELRGRALARGRTRPTTPHELDAVESAYLGRNGELRKLLGGIGRCPARTGRRSARMANPVREELEAAIAQRRDAARRDRARGPPRHANGRTSRFPAGRCARGSLHPLIETQREIARILGQFGFVIFEAPEVETDELNFELLNIPRRPPGPRPVGHALRREPGSRRAEHARRPTVTSSCCARTPRPGRSAPCAPSSRRSARSCPVAASATRRRRRATASSSSRSRG